MTLRTILGSALLGLALASCGDDGTSSDDAGSPTTSTAGATTGDADSSTGDLPSTTSGMSGDSTSAGSTGGDSTTTGGSSGSGDSTAGSDSGDSGDSGDSSDSGDSTGTTGGEFDVPGCGSCPSGSICLANAAFQTEYECVPLPRECAGEIDCECGEQLCEAPFVACFDPPDEPNSLQCICIAC